MPRRCESRAHGSRRSPAGRGPLCFSPETSAVGGCDALRWASPNVLHTASQTIHSFEYPYDVGVAPMTCEYVHLAAGLARGGPGFEDHALAKHTISQNYNAHISGLQYQSY